MATAKRIQGPWRYNVDAATMSANVYGKGGNHVAVVWSGFRPSIEVVEANARFIAAAPEMLVALDQCRRALHDEIDVACGGDYEPPRITRIRKIAADADKVIAKATGGKA